MGPVFAAFAVGLVAGAILTLAGFAYAASRIIRHLAQGD